MCKMSRISRSKAIIWLSFTLALFIQATCFSDAETNFQEGKDLFAAGKYDEAIKLLQSAIQLDSSITPECTLWIGRCYQYKANYEEAIRNYQKVLSDYPSSNSAAEAYYRIATAYEAKGDTAKALLNHQNQIESFPISEHSGKAILRIGDIYRVQGKYEQAMAQFEKAMKSYPETACRANILIGICYQDQQKYSEAMAALDKAIASGNGNGSTNQFVREARLRKAECLREQKKYDEELAYLETIATEHPELKDHALIRQSEVLTQIRQPAQAITKLQQLIAECPNSTFAVEAKARIANITLYGLKEINTARALLEDFIAKNPNYDGIIFVKDDLASTYYLERKYSEAAKLYKEAIEAPDNANWREYLMYMVGDCYMRLNDTANAKKEWDKLKLQYPNSNWTALAEKMSATYLKESKEDGK